MTDKLKPCPFCGCREQPIFSNILSGVVAVCAYCFARTGVVTQDTQQDALRIWNTRPVEDELRATADKLAEALDGLVNCVDIVLNKYNAAKGEQHTDWVEK